MILNRLIAPIFVVSVAFMVTTIWVIRAPFLCLALNVVLVTAVIDRNPLAHDSVSEMIASSKFAEVRQVSRTNVRLLTRAKEAT
jgi:hypothetical protein